MCSDIRQGEHESTDQLDQCIKDLVKRCQYQMEAEKMVCRTELLFHATKHFEVKKWVRSKKKREDVTYQALLQHAKEHEMMVKDFNWHKSKGGIATAMIVDEINSFKYRKGNSHRANFKGATGKTCNKCSMSHPLKECPVWGKKCHKYGNKNHLVLVVGQSRKALGTVRDHLMAGAQWDTLRIGADGPSWDPEADPTPKVPIVLSWTHFKTILSSMGDSPQMSMRDYPMISMGDTPFKTLRNVLILSKRHSILFIGLSQYWVWAMKWIQMAKPRSSWFSILNYHTEMAQTTCKSKLMMVHRLTFCP